MKEIKAIIQPHMLNHVMERLHSLPHFPGVTVSDCHGQGRGRGRSGVYVATEETVFFKKMTKLEVFCPNEACDDIVREIREAGHTGNSGDGVVTVIDLARVVRIRTGQEQEEAV